MWKSANAVMLLVYALSALVQLNDPDPLTWIAIYLAAAVACGLEVAGRQRWWFPAALAAIACAWALTLAPGVVGRVPFLDMFSAWEMKDAGVEESREMYGLLIVGVWMAVLAIRGGRAR